MSTFETNNAPVVELSPDTYSRLRRFAQQQRCTIDAIIAALLDRYERDEFWRQANESVNRLREDPVAWKDYKDEIALLEGGSMDGLEDEEPWFTLEEEKAIRAEAARTQGR